MYLAHSPLSVSFNTIDIHTTLADLYSSAVCTQTLGHNMTLPAVQPTMM